MLKDENIPTKECQEPLLELDPSEFVLESICFSQGITDTDKIKLREGVIEKLRKAHSFLREVEETKNWKFKIWDGFRPIKAQQKLFDDYQNSLREQHPEWDEERVLEATIEFVSPPNTNPNAPAPHNTGGAIDLTLVDENGKEIEMGAEYDDFNEKAHTDYFYKNESEDNAEGTFHRNRMLLKQILERTGLSNDPLEWWHFSYGDQEWAERTGSEHAIYGSAENM